jgi:hypothetical protein
MTSTSQADPAKAAPDSSSGKEAPEAKKEARQVPLEALAESREKAREAAARAEAAEAELARLKEQQKQPAAAAQPQGDDDIRKVVRDMQAKEQRRDLAAELGLVDDKQVEAVAGMLAKNPDLSRQEALELAAKRTPDLFQERGQPGYDPSVHGSTRPRAGSAPQPKVSNRDKRIKAMQEATGSDQVALVNQYVGDVARRVMGWDVPNRS